MEKKWSFFATVKGKLWLIVSVSTVIALVLWGAVFYVSWTAQSNSDQVATELAKAQAISDGMGLLQQLNTPASEVLETWDYEGGRVKLGNYKGQFDQQAARMDSLLTKDPALAAKFETVKKDMLALVVQANAVFDAAERKARMDRGGDAQAARNAMDRAGNELATMYKAFDRAAKSFGAMEVDQRNKIERMQEDAAASSRTLTLLTSGLLVIALVSIIGLGFWIIRSITRPLNEAIIASTLLAKGDLTARISEPPPDELGELLASMQSMMDYLNEMAMVSDRIAAGDLDVEIRPRSDDDRFGNAFKNMVDNTLKLVQSREERDRIQKSVIKLLDDVGGVAQGDLTREAEVTPDITGSIADSINFMIAELRRIIANVQDVTLQVSTSATETQHTTEHLAKGSEEQAKQIIQTSEAIDQMAASIQRVSENATVSATVAEQSLMNARQGAEAVQDTIQGMTRIRDQVQETAKRIKRLGESSQEIGEIVQLIEDIADRTSILALNASIQAAMAGEAGRGFAVVAEEVERLAERSTEATKRIASLVKTIQLGTNEAIAAMEESTHEVVEGSKLANQAGQALTEIEGVSNRLADLIQSISLSSKQQANGSEALAKSMMGISEITQQTATGIKQSAISVNQLAALADELRSSVASFKLPGKNGNGHGAPYANGNGHTNGGGNGHAYV